MVKKKILLLILYINYYKKMQQGLVYLLYMLFELMTWLLVTVTRGSQRS